MAGALEYSEEDLAGLHPSERAALLGTDDEELEDDIDPEQAEAAATRADREALEAILGDDPDVLGDDPAAAAAAATAKPAVAVVSTPEDEADEDDRAELRAGAIKTVNVDEAKTQLTELTGKRTALAEQLQNGDIDFAEYDSKSNELNDQIADLKSDIKTAENEMARQKSAEQALWDRQCKAFFAEHGTKEGKGGLYDHGELRYQALNAAVIKIANDPANGNKSGRAILRMAHQQLLDQGIVPPAKTEQANGKGAAAATKVKAKPEVPTLASAPAAEMSDTDPNDRFATFDNLPQHELEKALSKLSDSEMQAYLRR
jgi:hypothetical protein